MALQLAVAATAAVVLLDAVLAGAGTVGVGSTVGAVVVET